MIVDQQGKRIREIRCISIQTVVIGSATLPGLNKVAALGHEIRKVLAVGRRVFPGVRSVRCLTRVRTTVLPGVFRRAAAKKGEKKQDGEPPSSLGG